MFGIQGKGFLVGFLAAVLVYWLLGRARARA